MPQIAPALWLSLFISLIFLLLLTKILLYFYPLASNLSPSSLTNQTNPSHWKW